MKHQGFICSSCSQDFGIQGPAGPAPAPEWESIKVGLSNGKPKGIQPLDLAPMGRVLWQNLFLSFASKLFLSFFLPCPCPGGVPGAAPCPLPRGQILGEKSSISLLEMEVTLTGMGKGSSGGCWSCRRSIPMGPSLCCVPEPSGEQGRQQSMGMDHS